ncbi:MAG TPA: ATP-binding protein [Steroidobacter sp.]|uniref:sensor histidine kinase n=1 Tax=Steroidobacter sp. TaxID=1978227 RepID=UPI002ED95492
MTAPSILVVEDESLVAEELSMRLRQLGYDVGGVVDNAADAFSYVSVVRPDLAVVDIHIKGNLTGIDVARRFRTDFDVPVVFLTAHADSATLKDATSTEPFGYIVKPFDKRSLAATLETAVRRRRAEQKLAKMERWLAATMNSIGDAVITIDSELRVSFFNPVAERLSGWTQADAIGKPATEVFNIRLTSGATFASIIEQAMREGIVLNIDEATLTRRDGSTTSIDDSVAPIRDESGRMTGLVIVFRDASVRKMHEQQIRQLNGQLEEKVRLRTAQLEALNDDMSSFAHSIAHDLRAPLRAINAFASRIVSEHSSGLSGEGQRLLQVVTTQAMHMSTMVDDYLRLSGLTRVGLAHEQIDMTELAKEAWAVAITGVPESPALHLQSLPPTYGDRGLLRQVWANALSNAVKFTRDAVSPEVRITGREDDKVVRYCIEDNGIGFDPAHGGKLFRVFERLHGQDGYEGNGVGLCIMQRIVHRHEGEITIDGQPGKGARLEFWLPRRR